jgi:ABC-type molybdate transport system ATPase subunit
MSRVSLARQLLSDTGLIAAYSPAAAEGHAVKNNGKVILHVCNYSEQDITVTVLSGYIRAGLKLADRVVTVESGEGKFIGPFAIDIYNHCNGGAGQIYVDYSAVEGVEVAALLFP